ncbi:LSU ribosomal protein L41E [Candidatus Pacearchaeota archaeon CG1_02_32_21]|nr:MAG: LSU ribosomal protein L41E [Candidatus Pacearchaeota archaeon CG1_02_32_21]
MKRSSRRWKKKHQMRWKWQRKKLRKAKHLRKIRRARSK